jgi:uncharacterized protein
MNLLCTMTAMSPASRFDIDCVEDNNCQLSAQIAATEELVRRKLRAEPTGHDWWHAERVRRTALQIAEQEDADPLIVEFAALLHDIADYKFTGSDETGPRLAAEWLESIGIDGAVAAAVADIIRWMSYRGAQVDTPTLTTEGQCVQDADRLDAIGAIGIARTFAYGGYVRRPIHDPELPPVLHTTAEGYRNSVGTTINHFHEKLLLLRSRMNTNTGRALAAKRHGYLVDFLAQFEAEWTGTATD